MKDTRIGREAHGSNPERLIDLIHIVSNLEEKIAEEMKEIGEISTIARKRKLTQEEADRMIDLQFSVSESKIDLGMAREEIRMLGGTTQ